MAHSLSAAGRSSGACAAVVAWVSSLVVVALEQGVLLQEALDLLVQLQR
jgi:hypothetical protein